MLDKEVVEKTVNRWLDWKNKKIQYGLDVVEIFKDDPDHEIFESIRYIEAYKLACARCHESARILALFLKRELGVETTVKDGSALLAPRFLEYFLENMGKPRDRADLYLLNRAIDFNHSWLELADGHTISYWPHIRINDQIFGKVSIERLLLIFEPGSNTRHRADAEEKIIKDRPVIIYPNGKRIKFRLSPEEIEYLSHID